MEEIEKRGIWSGSCNGKVCSGSLSLSLSLLDIEIRVRNDNNNNSLESKNT